MAKKESKSIKEIKKFGLVLGCGFGVLGGVIWWKGRGVYPYFFGISITMFFLSVVFPKALRPVERVWMAGVKCIGWVVTRIILSVLYLIAIIPLGIIRRIFVKDPLSIKFKELKDSYWIPRHDDGSDTTRYERQF